MNLVGPGPLDFHFEDCARALDGLEPTGHWADLGSGAGFPGIVFADRFPEIPLDLVDSRRKRCVFLGQVIGEGLPEDHAPVTVHCARVEDLPDQRYDGLMSRALAPPPEVVTHARRLLRPGGLLLLMLQSDTPLPDAPDFEIVGETHYTVDGKQRRAVRLKRS